MNSSQCPDPETLLADEANGKGSALDHLSHCQPCRALIEEHRQLEKGLYRLMDPLPPLGFVDRVMARVAAEPAPVGRELWVGLPILAAAMVLCVGVVWFSGGLGMFVALTASTLVAAQHLSLVANKVFSTLWVVAPGPTAVALFAISVCALLTLRHLAGSTRFSEARITS